ncbi:hypothetical protein [Sulfuricystis multivorans]|uniref:hypothetical protein n=1 Tax=Sulfuricystis multivorans TaxID=2211108 RepID=UPI000F8372C4|nr:hypothetical protein [Sulfuricystis multivorans]
MRIIIGIAVSFLAALAIAGDLGRIESRVEGVATLRPEAGAVYAQFVGSPSITDTIRRDLAAHGFAVAWNKADAKQYLTLKGSLSIKSSNGKAAQEDIAAIAEGQRVALSVPVKEKPTPAHVPEGHYTIGDHGQQPNTQQGISLVTGNPIPVDLGDQGRWFSKRMFEKGIGNDPSCPPERCRVAQIITQQTIIDIEVTKNGRTEKGKVIASMKDKFVNMNVLTVRALYLAMDMVRGGR